MPEREEGKQYRKKNAELLEKLKEYNISEVDFILYLYTLEEHIANEIREAGRVPKYAYIMIINEVLPYEYRDNIYLELSCSFKPQDGCRDDITVVGPFIEDFEDSDGHVIVYDIDDLSNNDVPNSTLFPLNANAVMNVNTGFCSSRIDWAERAI